MSLKRKKRVFKGSELTPGVKRKRPCKKKNYYRLQNPTKPSNKLTEEEKQAKRDEVIKKRTAAKKEFEKWYK